MKNIEVEKIEKKLDEFIAARDWEQFHSVKNLAMALSVETSELLEIFQWMKEEESNKLVASPEVKAKVAEEIADIFIYLSRIAKKAEIDINEAVFKKMEKNQGKYPEDKARGNAKKYTELG